MGGHYRKLWTIRLYWLVATKRWMVHVVSSAEGTVKGYGKTPNEAYRAACVKLVAKPWLEAVGE